MMRSRNAEKEILVVLAIVLFGLVFRLLFQQGFWVTADDYNYSLAATEISEGNFQLPTNHWNARIGNTFSIAFFYKIFGVNEYSAIGASMVYSMLIVVLIILLSKEIFDAEHAFKIGATAAIFYSVVPISISHGSSLSFSPAITFLMFASVYFLLLAERKERRFCYAASGLCIGFSYLFHATGAYVFFAIAAYFIYKKKLPKEVGYIFGGFLSIVACENIFYYFESGTWLYRQKVSIGTHFRIKNVESIKDVMVVNNKLKAIPNVFSGTFLGDSWMLEPFRQLFLNPAHSIIYHLFFLVSACFLFKKDKKVMLLSLFFWPMFIYFSYGSPNPISYQPLRRLPRYILPCLIPVCMAVSYGMHQTIKKKQLQAALVLVFTVVSLLSLSIKGGQMGQRMHQSRFFYSFINQHPDERYYTDSTTLKGLLYLSGHQKLKGVTVIPRLEYIKKIKDQDFIKKNRGAHFLINIPEIYEQGTIDLNELTYELIDGQGRKARKICFLPGIQALFKDRLCNTSNGGTIYKIKMLL